MSEWTGEAITAPFRARLRPTRLRPGYAVEDVEGLLARVDQGLAGSEDVTNAQFTSTRFGRGYDEQTVDEMLDDLVALLRQHGR